MYRIRIPYSELLIKAAFFLFFFFTFFPMSEPFQRGYSEIERSTDNIQEGNQLNQIFKVIIFILTVLASFYRIDNIISLVRREKFLIIFLGWALLSVLWSDVPVVTLKRWFQIYLIYFLIVTFFSYYSIIDAIHLIKITIYPYIIVTIISCLVIPGAIDPDFGTWRGLTTHKNTLGQVGVILSVLTLIIYNIEKEKLKRNIAKIFFILSVIITLATFSSTSYIALFIFLTGTTVYFLHKKLFEPLRIKNYFFMYSVLTAIIIFIIFMIFVPEIPDYIQGIFGKSETWYDRGKLWKVMLWNISQHPLIGCGFQAFWTVENIKVHIIHGTFIWLPMQAHNGYLDLLNELGIIGLILFLLVVIKNVFKSFKHKILTPWLWFLILPLVSNVTESNFMRVGPITTIFLILAYLILEKILVKKEGRLYE